jgi:hypothetical protein
MTATLNIESHILITQINLGKESYDNNNNIDQIENSRGIIKPVK